MQQLSTEALPSHASIWQRLQLAMHNQRLPQALLLVGPKHASILQFVHRLMSIVLCKNDTAPCGYCQSCHLILQDTHPDIRYVRQDTLHGPIKIDQIRDLQQTVYQTPQCGTQRFIVLETADKLNTAAANALLKILEEPPRSTRFILIADQVSSLPATVKSRCQQYVFPTEHHGNSNAPLDYFMTNAYYADSSQRAALLSKSYAIVAALCDLVEEKTTVCQVAGLFTQHDLADVLWFFYLITSQAIYYQLMGEPQSHEPLPQTLLRFSKNVQSVLLFKQLSKILAVTKKTHQNITLNATLTLEALLLGYQKGDLYVG